MRRTPAVSNDVVEGRFQARLRAMHRDRIKKMQPVVQDAAPARYPHLDVSTKPPPREQTIRNRVIQHDNSLLVDKMCSILARKPKPNHDTVLLTKAAHATVEDAYRPGPIPLPKSLNKEARTRQLEQIVWENERFLQRLIASPGVYRRSQWDRAAKEEEKLLDLVCKFPYQHPSLMMPQINPMLAIANAQSNRAAQQVLRQTQQLQQQQPGAFPAVNGASYPSTPGALGPSPIPFASTTGSIPPYPPSPLAATGNIPNHFPLPLHAAYPSPPGTAASGVRPTPPATARPGTSISRGGAVSPPKLRAQYTAQGVRIIRTTRTHVHPATARPNTALDPLKPSSKKHQPLRAAQAAKDAAAAAAAAKAQEGATEEHKEEQKEAAPAAVVSNGEQPAAGGTGEPQGDGSASQGQHAQQPAGDRSQPQPQQQAPGTASGPGQVAPLFSDTLVISGRPVLVRIAELGTPWRLEIKVFDPYTQLEYNLALPWTYIRMVFYQVPDLLAPHNRHYLAQTLLHYLVFAPAMEEDGRTPSPQGGLELLVDIVAPPPRSAAEAAAWEAVQAAAAEEAAAWALEAETARARARTEAETARAAEEQAARLAAQAQREGAAAAAAAAPSGSAAATPASGSPAPDASTDSLAVPSSGSHERSDSTISLSEYAKQGTPKHETDTPGSGTRGATPANAGTPAALTPTAGGTPAAGTPTAGSTAHSKAASAAASKRATPVRDAAATSAAAVPSALNAAPATETATAPSPAEPVGTAAVDAAPPSVAPAAEAAKPAVAAESGGSAPAEAPGPAVAPAAPSASVPTTAEPTSAAAPPVAGAALPDNVAPAAGSAATASPAAAQPSSGTAPAKEPTAPSGQAPGSAAPTAGTGKAVQPSSSSEDLKIHGIDASLTEKM